MPEQPPSEDALPPDESLLPAETVAGDQALAGGGSLAPRAASGGAPGEEVLRVEHISKSFGAMNAANCRLPASKGAITYTKELDH